MRIKNAEYVLSAHALDQLPGGELPEIAMAGRSNVGKSSLINRLANHKSLARISSVPGKTRAINYYLINSAFHLVDLPGYGYAKVSRDEQERWGRLIEGYLSQRAQLRGVFLIVDMRHKPTDQDKQMHGWLEHYDLPRLVVATKADKLSRGRWKAQMDTIRRELEIPPTGPEVLDVVAFSASKGFGKDDVLTAIETIVSYQRY